MECWCRIQHGRNFEKSLVKKRPYIVLEAQHLKSCAFRDCRPILRSGPFSTCSPLPGCHCQLPGFPLRPSFCPTAVTASQLLPLAGPSNHPVTTTRQLDSLTCPKSCPATTTIHPPVPLTGPPHHSDWSRGSFCSFSYGLPFYYIELFHLYRICRIGKFMQTESRLVFARGCGTGAWKMIADGFRIFRVKKMFRN